MAIQVIMPQLGESVVEGTVTRWFKQEGDSVADMESLLEVETDKVTTEVPSSGAGTMLKILVAEGTTVKAGTVLAYIGAPGEAVPEGGAAAPQAHAPAPKEAKISSEPTATLAQPTAPAQPQADRSRDLGFISPVVARLAKDKNVDLYQVRGTGEGGRITKKDVLSFLESGAGQPAPAQPEAAAWETPGEGDLFRPTEMMFGGKGPGQPRGKGEVPAGNPAEPGPQPPVPTPSGPSDRLLPHTSVRRAIAEHMVHSKHTSPHVTTVMEADLTRVIAHRAANKAAFAESGANLTFTPYFVAASVAALKAVPLVNSSWTEEGVLLRAAINIGMATSLGEDGLIVPIIKGADGLSLLGIARAVNDLANRARARRLQPDEVRGGTFTITNHGISGSLFATPIINQPQCAILGVGAIQKRAVVIHDAIAIRSMVYVSLTFDHRILDGAAADGFLQKLVDALENWG
jgi:2-oxoglutarate dehydrogenase E2 component (dihydrolipoamide succinyltransferase)